MGAVGSVLAEAEAAEASTAPFALALVSLPDVAVQYVNPLLSFFTSLEIKRNNDTNIIKSSKSKMKISR